MQTYDAGNERETLAQELATWKAAGWMESQRAFRWFRRVKRLAKVLQMPVEQVRQVIDEDAQEILNAAE